MECLESEEWCGAVVGAGAGGGAAAEAHEQSAAEEARAAKEGVVLLVLQLLPAAAPNFAHFLLGYQLNDDVSALLYYKFISLPHSFLNVML